MESKYYHHTANEFLLVTVPPKLLSPTAYVKGRYFPLCSGKPTMSWIPSPTSSPIIHIHYFQHSEIAFGEDMGSCKPIQHPLMHFISRYFTVSLLRVFVVIWFGSSPPFPSCFWYVKSTTFSSP